MNIGFSTGSVALGDFNRAIHLLNEVESNAIELSALREHELEPLISTLPTLGLAKYRYVSFHAPSKLEHYTESQVVHLLQVVAARGWHVIVHPDIIKDYSVWNSLGRFLCIENMDKRKPIGRTAADLDKIFSLLPEATFCLDVAHARQVDPTMLECHAMLKKFRSRLVEIHLSDVTSSSHHVRLNAESIYAYKKIAELISADTPVIIESPVLPQQISAEIETAKSIFISHTENGQPNPLYRFQYA